MRAPRRQMFLPNGRLKAALVASGKRQYQIAHDAGIKETDLSSIVRGVRRSTRREREGLASVLGVDLVELFAEEGREAPDTGAPSEAPDSRLRAPGVRAFPTTLEMADEARAAE